MSTIIERLEHGYIVTHHDKRSVETAEHVANLILHHWPDVAEWIRHRMGLDVSEEFRRRHLHGQSNP